MIELKNNPAGNFFLLAGPCVIEGEEMAMRIAERVVNITEKLQIPYVFKGSYRKANRSRLDSFMGIGDEKALKVLQKVHDTFGVPTVTDIHSAEEAAMAAMIESSASSVPASAGAKPPSSPTAVLRPRLWSTFFSAWNTSAPIRSPSRNDGAPTGRIMNS